MGKARKVEDEGRMARSVAPPVGGVVAFRDVEMFPARRVAAEVSLRARLAPDALRKPSLRRAAG